MTIQITDTELKELVRSACEQAAEQAVSAYIAKTTKVADRGETSGVGDVSEHDIQNMMDVMRANMDTQNNPKVGIFWYQMVGKRLFGVIAVDKDSIKRPNVGGGLITCNELHKDVWKKKYHQQKYKNGGKGPYVGDYKDHARGRVFYNPTTDEYTVTVGSWIDECPEAKEMIIEEFNLFNVKCKFEKNIHWEIGNGWENQ